MRFVASAAMRFDGSEPKNPPLSSTLSRLAGSAPFTVIDPKSCAVSLRGLSQCAGVILLQPGPINGLADKSVSACMMPVIQRYENYCFLRMQVPLQPGLLPVLLVVVEEGEVMSYVEVFNGARSRRTQFNSTCRNM